MTKIPHARAKAADASLPTFVDPGNAFFNILLTHANGGSNSIADAPVDAVDLVGSGVFDDMRTTREFLSLGVARTSSESLNTHSCRSKKFFVDDDIIHHR